MPSRRTHVFVLIDALGWRLLEERDFLPEYLPYREPLRTVLGFSSAAIPTILTGEPPRRHGHWSLFYYDPRRSPFRWLRLFGALPRPVLDHRITRRLITELGRRVLGMGPLFECCVSPALLPKLDWVEKRDIYACHGITGAPSIFDSLAAAGIEHRVYTYKKWSDAQILDRACRDIQAGAGSVYFLYLCEMDHFLHLHRAETPKWQERLKWYESRLREVFQAARRVDPSATLAVFSDHGMAPVHAHHDLIREVEAAGLRQPSDYLAVYDSTMARFWFFSETARRRILEQLERSTCGRLLPVEELSRLGVFFEDGRYGQAVFLLHPGWMLTRSDFNGPRWNPKGMHGYHPDDPDSYGVFLAGPAPAEPLGEIASVYRHMRDTIGLPATAPAQP